MSVRDTTGGLRERDDTAVISVDAVADIDQTRHEMARKRMKKIYGARLTRAGIGEQEVSTAA